MRRAPLVLNTAFYPALMWNGRFAARSDNPFDNRAGFAFPPPEGLTLSYLPHLLTAQAFIPPTERNEAAGFEFPGDNFAIRGAAEALEVTGRKHLMAAQRVEDWNFDFPPSPPAAIPADVMTDKRTLTLNRTTLELKYYGPAHTDGDLSVTIPEADLLHCGDTYWNGIYPFIDYSTGGNIDGMIRAAEANVAAATDTTIVIPGHGKPVSNKAELSAYRDMLVTIHEKVATLKREGRSLDETISARPTAAFDAKWGQFVVSPAFFTKLVYEGA